MEKGEPNIANTEVVPNEPFLTADDFLNKFGSGVFKKLEGLLKSPPVFLEDLPLESQTPQRQDYENLLNIVAEGKFGVVIKNGAIELHPIKLKNITFSDMRDSKIFTHETTDKDLTAINNPSKDRFVYIAVEDSPVGHGNISPGVKGYRVTIDAEILFKERSVYLDPESIEHIRKNTELGKSFIVPGGIPKSAVLKIKEVNSFMQVD